MFKIFNVFSAFAHPKTLAIPNLTGIFLQFSPAWDKNFQNVQYFEFENFQYFERFEFAIFGSLSWHFQ